MTPEQIRENAALMVIRRCKADGYHGNGDEPCGICADAARGIRAMRIDGPCDKCGGEGFTVVYGHGGDAEQEMCDECDPGGYCIVPGCENRQGEGTFEGPICGPCAIGFRTSGGHATDAASRLLHCVTIEDAQQLTDGAAELGALRMLRLAIQSVEQLCEEEGFHGHGDRLCDICQDHVDRLRKLWSPTKRSQMIEEWRRERASKLWEEIDAYTRACGGDPGVVAGLTAAERSVVKIEAIALGCPACGGSGRVLGDFGESLQPCSHCQGRDAISYPTAKWPRSVVEVRPRDGMSRGSGVRWMTKEEVRRELKLPAPAPTATLWTGLLTGGQAGVDWVGARNALGSVLASLEAQEGDVVALRLEVRKPEQKPT